MKIVLDATPLTVETGGIRRYTSELALALARLCPADQVWLVSDQRFPPLEEQPINLRRYESRGGLVERRWWLFGLPALLRRLDAEVFHGTDFAVPYLRLRPSVMTIHDLSPWKEEPWRAPSERIRSRTPILLRMGLATMVITPCEPVRQEVISVLRVPAERVVAVPLAASAWFCPAPELARDAPYFLHVGTIEPRKNLDLLIRAWREVYREFGVELLLAGRTRKQCATPATEEGLQFLGPVPEADLPALYSGALAVVLPSFYEGFGLPVLEAMQCGAAVIAAGGPALRETGGDAALYVDADDTAAWVVALRKAAADPHWVAGQRERSLRRATLFTWEKTAARTREVYDEAIRRFGR